MSEGTIQALFLAGLTLLACLCGGIVHQTVEESCRDRGGHLEWVYGGRGGYVCYGAAK